MQDFSNGSIDMKSTRDVVLQTLLLNNRCTINKLAEAVGINPISVRHHIAKLEAENLVVSQEERHGVGRPRRVYFLTQKGMEHFPSRYVQMSIRLLEQLKQTISSTDVKNLFSKIGEDIVADHTDPAQLGGLSLEKRLDLMQEVLSHEGFIVSWDREGDTYHIHEISCPYIHIGQTHPEICALDQTIISKVLAVPVEKIKCVLKDGEHCTYTVNTPTK
jgi:predicted ArsR family transcriptional regulator